jgi:hypothetical protein
MKSVYVVLTLFRQSHFMKHLSLGFDKATAEDLAQPEIWLGTLFSSQAARDGQVIRRSLRDICPYAGFDAFVAEVGRRGDQAVENSDQVVIFCNRAPIRSLTRR